MKKMRARYIAAMLSLVMAAGLASCSAKQQTADSKGYKTPEKAVEAYLDGFKKMDLEQMIGTFAVDNYAENYDFEGQIERLSAYTYNMQVKLPNATALARDLNTETRRSNVSSAILRQYVSLSRPGFNITELQELRGEGRAVEFADQFAQKLEAVKTDTIKTLGFIPPEDINDIYDMDKNQENIAKLAKIYGADEMQSCAAVFELDGKEYLMCVDAANYGGRWYIIDLGGNLGSLLGLDIMSGGMVPLRDLDLDTDWEDLLVPVS